MPAGTIICLRAQSCACGHNHMPAGTIICLRAQSYACGHNHMPAGTLLCLLAQSYAGWHTYIPLGTTISLFAHIHSCWLHFKSVCLYMPVEVLCKVTGNLELSAVDDFTCSEEVITERHEKTHDGHASMFIAEFLHSSSLRSHVNKLSFFVSFMFLSALSVGDEGLLKNKGKTGQGEAWIRRCTLGVTSLS